MTEREPAGRPSEEPLAFIGSARYNSHMGTPARVAGLLLFGLFVSVLALRPVVANPAIAGAIRDGISGPGLLLVAPLVLVALFVVALRLRSVAGEDDHEAQYGVASESESFWDRRTSGATTGGRGDAGDSLAGDSLARESENGDTDGATADSQPADGPDGDPGETTGILGGQGGSREREFEIEAEPPDANLSEHFDHLQEELDDDETVARDLEQLDAVAQEVEGDRTIPARCPQNHCGAVWTGRTVLGIGTDRYEVLDDGERVQCLECEEIHTVE